MGGSCCAVRTLTVVAAGAAGTDAAGMLGRTEAGVGVSGAAERNSTGAGMGREQAVRAAARSSLELYL